MMGEQIKYLLLHKALLSNTLCFSDITLYFIVWLTKFEFDQVIKCSYNSINMVKQGLMINIHKNMIKKIKLIIKLNYPQLSLIKLIMGN